MENNQLLLLKGKDIEQLLNQQEAAIITAVKEAYQVHAKQQSIMPPNSYLRFPQKEKERIIAKAAYLGGNFQEAGLKWIASFPNNLSKGIERASATLILNDVETGHPTAILESSIISAKRTAASAALAAHTMSQHQTVTAVGMIGCGLINFETLRFLLHVFPSIEQVHLLDLSTSRAQAFTDKAKQLNPNLQISTASDLKTLLNASQVVACGTTAVTPFIDSLQGSQAKTVVLHTSLRDLTHDLILHADNVVDDIEQVCSNQTSLHLAEQQVGNRKFIRTTIGDILNGDANPYDSTKDIAIFSPFGLGILDLAVGHLVKKLAKSEQKGLMIEEFLPQPWLNRN